MILPTMEVNKLFLKAVLGGAIITSIFFFSQEKAWVIVSNESEFSSQGSVIFSWSDDTDQTIQHLFDETHPAGDDFDNQSRQTKLNTLCAKQSQICDITTYNGLFTAQEKFIYQSISIYLLKRIDTFITTSQKVSSTLQSLSINKENDGRRGYAWHQTIVVNLSSIKGYKEFMEILAHELGHIVDLGVVEGSSSLLDKNFTEFNAANFGIDDPSLKYYQISWLGENTRSEDSTAQDFVSGYGMTNTFEDFAEAHNLYLMHNAVFQQMAKNNTSLAKKYAFLSKLYGGKFIFAGKNNVVKIATKPDRRPWDTTRIN